MIDFKSADVILVTGKTPALGFMTCDGVRYLFWRERRARITDNASFAFFRVTEESEQRIRCGVYKTFDEVWQGQGLSVGNSVTHVKIQGLANPQIIDLQSTYVQAYDPEDAPEFYQADFKYTDLLTSECTRLYPHKTVNNPNHLDAWCSPDDESNNVGEV